MGKESFKELKCRDAGGYCSFVARARTEEEAIEIVLDHIGLRHGIWETVRHDKLREWRKLMNREFESLPEGGFDENVGPVPGRSVPCAHESCRA